MATANIAAVTTSAGLRPLVHGAVRPGIALGRSHIAFGPRVVSLTRPGAPRMPNGIEVGVETSRGMATFIGEGRLILGHLSILLHEEWDPVPRSLPTGGPPREPDGLLDLVGRGPGLTPAGDDLLAGYVAGLALLHGRYRLAADLVERARDRTTSLSMTFLEHAARGEVPEPVHAFLERSDPSPLLAFGHSSGRFWLEGLARAGAPAWVTD